MTVMDYRDKLPVEVTRPDLLFGERGTKTRCAIQKAIRRIYPEYSHIWIGEEVIKFTDSKAGVRWSFPVPGIIKRFEEEYDKGENPYLFFELRFDEAYFEPVKPTQGSPKGYVAPNPKRKGSRISRNSPDKSFG